MGKDETLQKTEKEDQKDAGQETTKINSPEPEVDKKIEVVDSVEERESKLKETEMKIDKKIDELRSLKRELALEGKGFSIEIEQMKQDEKITAECNKFLAGTGLQI